MNSISDFFVHHSQPSGWPQTVGLPLAADQLSATLAKAAVRQADGTLATAQLHTLVPQTPGGVAWVEANFLATVEGPAELVVGDAATAAPAAAATLGMATVLPDGVEIVRGNLRVRLSTDPAAAPIAIALRTAAAAPWQPFGSLRPELATVDGVVHLPDPAVPRQVQILRDGPVRAQVEITGRLVGRPGEPSFHWRLTVDLWAGSPALRVDYMLTNEIPGRLDLPVRRASLIGDWAVGGSPTRRFAQTSHGPLYRRREVENPATVALVTDFTSGPVHVREPEMLLDGETYAHYLVAPTVNTEDWLALVGDAGSVYATLADFMQTRPSALESSGSRLQFDLIPPAGEPTKWPQGRRKEQTLLLLPALGAPVDAKTAARALTAPWTVGRSQPSRAVLERLQIWEMRQSLGAERGRQVKLNDLLHRLSNLDTPGDKWNLGDTPDYGYTRTYAAVPGRLATAPGFDDIRYTFNKGGREIWPDPVGEWIEPVWTNNEYDFIHTLATQVLRTEQDAFARLLRWCARHTVEVDFLSYNDDPWHHRATPAHSRNHNTTGAYPSHMWTQGLLQYYLISGDRDAREVCEALGDKILASNADTDSRPWGFDRELGWGLLSLICLVEAGIDRGYLADCTKVVDFLMAYDRDAFAGPVNYSNANAKHTLVRQMVGNGFCFSPMVEAIDRYQRITGRADTAAWLEKLIDEMRIESWNAILESDTPRINDMITHVLALGYERTGDRDYLDCGLVILESYWHSIALGDWAPYWGRTKPSAMAYRALFRFLGHADTAGLLDAYEFTGVLAKKRALEEG